MSESLRNSYGTVALICLLSCWMILLQQTTAQSEPLATTSPISISVVGKLVLIRKPALTIYQMELSNSSSENCNLTVLDHREEKSRVLNELEDMGYSMDDSDLDAYRLVRICQESQHVTSTRWGSTSGSHLTFDGKDQFLLDATALTTKSNAKFMIEDGLNPDTLIAFFRGILPGTKWCGAGNIASGFYDLGTQFEVDKCCRAHDRCPININAFQTKYGFFNYFPFTVSLCNCDTQFYNCLKRVRRPSQRATANLVGNLFFNLIQLRCITPTFPKFCASVVKVSGTSFAITDPPKEICLRYLENSGVEPTGAKLLTSPPF